MCVTPYPGAFPWGCSRMLTLGAPPASKSFKGMVLGVCEMGKKPRDNGTVSHGVAETGRATGPRTLTPYLLRSSGVHSPWPQAAGCDSGACVSAAQDWGLTSFPAATGRVRHQALVTAGLSSWALIPSCAGASNEAWNRAGPDSKVWTLAISCPLTIPPDGFA